MSKRAKTKDSTEVTRLEIVKSGRKVVLGDVLDSEIQRHIPRLCGNGTSISIALVLAAAEAYLLARDRTVLVEYDGHVSLTKDWARSLLILVPFQLSF